jgi:hypothetical protein
MDKIRLETPPSLTERWEVIGAVERNNWRGCAAALHLCWLAGPDRKSAPDVKLRDHGFDMLAYGGAVIEALLQRGWRPKQVTDLGRDAYAVVIADLVSQADVEAEEGNFVPDAEGSTASSSTSSGSGDSASGDSPDSRAESKPA